MRKIKRRVDSFEFTHPNDTDIVIGFKRLNQLEALEFLFDISGDLRMTPTAVAALFKRAVIFVKGIKDQETDEPVHWTGDPSILFDKELNITLEDGSTQTLWEALLDAIQKLSVASPKATS